MSEGKKIPAEVCQMAEYAYKTVPMYIELAEKKKLNIHNFLSLPVMGKNDYMKSGAASLSIEYVTRFLNHQLLVRRTSGSTGKVTDYYWSVEDEKKSLFELWYYRMKYYQISPKDKMVLFFPISIEKEEVMESDNVLGLSKSFLYNGCLEKAYEKILQYSPEWMILQPSVAWMLCTLIRKKNLPVPDSLQYIEFTGEYLEDNIREQTEAVFHCKTANQYGMGETNSIAYECPCGNMHVMSENIYVEIINAQENVGDICVTTLKNMAMPYIRYNTGDKGTLHYQKCLCGNSDPILEIYNGRSNDWVRKQNGEKLHPFSLIQVINEVNSYILGAIVQFQIIQKNYGTFIFKLVVKEKTDVENLEKMLCYYVLQRMQEELEISFCYYEQIIPDRKTGKIATFFCEMD